MAVQIQITSNGNEDQSKERKWDIGRWKWADYWRLKPAGGGVPDFVR